MRHPNRNSLFLVSAALVLGAATLTACSGGDGPIDPPGPIDPVDPLDPDGNDTSVDPVDGGTSGGDSAMSLLDKWQRFEAGAPTLRMTYAQILEASESTSRRATHELVGGHVLPYQHQVVELPPDWVLAPVLEHNGVDLVESRGRYPFVNHEGNESFMDLVDYAGWLDHTYFIVSFRAICEVDAPGCSGARPAYASAGTYSPAPRGYFPETTPTGMGSATWDGVMIGMTSREFPALDQEQAAVPAWVHEVPDVWLGDAQIRIEDLAAPDIDVSFTNIHLVTTNSHLVKGAKHPDMRWEGLPVDNGLFGSGDSDDYIAGMFTGPQHQEAGGQFMRDGIVGSFGAKRR